MPIAKHVNLIYSVACLLLNHRISILFQNLHPKNKIHYGTQL